MVEWLLCGCVIATVGLQCAWARAPGVCSVSEPIHSYACIHGRDRPLICVACLAATGAHVDPVNHLQRRRDPDHMKRVKEHVLGLFGSYYN